MSVGAVLGCLGVLSLIVFVAFLYGMDTQRSLNCKRAGYHEFLLEKGALYCTATERVPYDEAMSTKRLK